MAWVTPKQNWDTNTGIGFTDLNNIGGNLSFLRDRYVISGQQTYSMGGNHIDAGATIDQQKIGITIPVNKQLILYSTNQYLYNAESTVLVLSVSAINTYTGTLEIGEEYPDFMLASNVTGSPVITTVTIGIKNTSVNPADPYNIYASWMIRMYLADV